MMIVPHPTYTLRVTVKDALKSSLNERQGLQAAEGKPHKYFDAAGGKTGCDEVLNAVKAALIKSGVEADVSLERFEHKA